jgi:hypothetical protein
MDPVVLIFVAGRPGSARVAAEVQDPLECCSFPRLRGKAGMGVQSQGTCPLPGPPLRPADAREGASCRSPGQIRQRTAPHWRRRSSAALGAPPLKAPGFAGVMVIGTSEKHPVAEAANAGGPHGVFGESWK